MPESTDNNTFNPLTPVAPVEAPQAQIERLSNDIKLKGEQSVDPLQFGQSYMATMQNSQSILGGNNKISTYNYETGLSDAYTQLNSGEYVARFENYLPGVNNEQRLAVQQTSGEKWANGVTKFLGKTGTAVLGGTVGVVDGLVNAISEGSLSAAYDSDFNNWLDDLNTKMDYNLPNYYTEQEKGDTFFGSMGTSNFWANDVLGALSFTTGAIVSEGMWAAATGGTSLLGKGLLSSLGRAGLKKAAMNDVKATVKDYLGSVAKKEVKDLTRSATRSGRFIEGLNTTRFLMTSAGYEAGVEARHYMHETKDKWLQNFEQTNGRKPTPQEQSQFEDTLTTAANSVFAVNIGLVGASNLATIGRLALGRPVSTKVSNNALKRFFFGVGYEKAADGTLKAAKASNFQKVFGRIYTAGKVGAIEGVFEEGGQGITSSTAEDFMLNGYDEEGARTSLDISDSFIRSIGSTFGTREGFKEVGIGVIVGLLGGGLNSATTGQGLFGEIEAERSNLESLIKNRNAFTNEMVAETIIERLKANSRIQNAVKKRAEAEAKGDVTGSVMFDQEVMLATIEKDFTFQGLDQGVKDFEAAMATVPNSDISSETGIDEQDVQAWKEQKVNEYRQLANEYKENINFAKSLVGNLPIKEADSKIRPNIERAIAFNLSIGTQADQLSKTLLEEIKANVAEEVIGSEATRAMDVQETLRKVEAKRRGRLGGLTTKKKRLEEQAEKIKNELVGFQYETTTPNQDATARTNRQKQLQDNLIRVQAQIDQTAQEQQILLDTINAAYVDEANLTIEDLDNQAANVEKLRGTVESIKDSSPQRHAILTRLFQEYEKAVKHAKAYDTVTKKITDESTSVTELSGWVASLTSKLKKTNGDTEAFFRDIVERYVDELEGIRRVDNIDRIRMDMAITEEEYQTFLSTQEVPERVLADIANSVAYSIPLSNRQAEIRNAKFREIEEMVNSMRNSVQPPTPPAEQAPTPKSSIESIKQKIKEIISGKYASIYSGNDPEELAKQEPSSEDIEKYNELLDKVKPEYLMDITFNGYDPQAGLTQEEFTEFIELNQKLNNWKTLQGTTVGEADSLAGLLQLLKQKQQAFEKENTNPDITEEDYVEVSTAPENRPDKDASESLSTIQNPNQVLVATERGTTKYRFSHLSIQGLLSLIPGGTLYRVDNAGVEKLDQEANGKEKGQVYSIHVGDQKLRVEVGDRARLLIDMESFDNFPTNIKLLTFQGNKTAYYSAYTTIDGVDQPIEGDFVYASTLEGENIDFNPQKVYDLKPGQTLRTEVNKNDVWNAQLLEEYENSDKKKADKEKLIRGLNIYVTPEGANSEIVGSLRAVGVDKEVKLSDSSSLTNLYNLRKYAVDKVLKAKNDKVDLGRTMQVRFTLIGNPNLEVEENAEGRLVPKNIDFTDEAIEQVEDIGYIENGEIKTQKNLQLTNKETIFARAINKEGKTPIIVFRYRGIRQAFPISLKKTPLDKSERLKRIMAEGLPASQSIMQIERLLAENNFDPSEYDLDPSYEAEVNGELVNWTGSPGMQKALQDLSTIQVFEDVNNFLEPNYDKSNLKAVASIPLDITNRPFSAGKTIIDLSEIGHTEAVNVAREEVEEVRELRDSIYQDAVLIENTINETVAADSNLANRKNVTAFEAVLDDAAGIEGENVEQGVSTLRKALFENPKDLRGERQFPRFLSIRLPDNFKKNLSNKVKRFAELQSRLIQSRVLLKDDKLKNEIKNEKTCPQVAAS